MTELHSLNYPWTETAKEGFHFTFDHCFLARYLIGSMERTKKVGMLLARISEVPAGKCTYGTLKIV
jgi:hypothetical protein